MSDNKRNKGKNTTKATVKKAPIKAQAEAVEQREETKPVEAAKTFTLAEVQEMIKAAVAEATANAKPIVENTVMQVAPIEYVTLMFTGRMAEGCVVGLGELGKINSDFGTIDVPKRAFLQKRDYKVDKLLSKRVIVVLNGLDDKELERFNLKYKDGEILTPELFSQLLDLETGKLTEVFGKLCEGHKREVASLFYEAYMNKDNRIDLDKVKALNDLTKDINEEGLFIPILKEMSREIVS